MKLYYRLLLTIIHITHRLHTTLYKEGGGDRYKCGLAVFIFTLRGRIKMLADMRPSLLEQSSLTR